MSSTAQLEKFLIVRAGLLAIFLDGLTNGTVQIAETIRKDLLDWYISQPVFIQKLCHQCMVDVGMISVDLNNVGGLSTVE